MKRNIISNIITIIYNKHRVSALLKEREEKKTCNIIIKIKMRKENRKKKTIIEINTKLERNEQFFSSINKYIYIYM